VSRPPRVGRENGLSTAILGPWCN